MIYCKDVVFLYWDIEISNEIIKLIFKFRHWDWGEIDILRIVTLTMNLRDWVCTVHNETYWSIYIEWTIEIKIKSWNLDILIL